MTSNDPTKLKSKPLKGLCSEPPTQTSDVYLNEVIGELERAYSAIESFTYDVNLFEKKAWKLKVIDDRGHQFFIQDLMDFDDIVRSSGKKARKAKSWLKQLSTTSEEMDLTEHDLIYFGLEKRISAARHFPRYICKI